jgi:hypothetical protein
MRFLDVFYFILLGGMVTYRAPRDKQDEMNFSAIAEWSKIVVWSFLAGFSERLVSSSLDKIGSK